MNRFFLTVLTVGSMWVALPAFAQSPATKVSASKGWLNNLDAAKAQSAKTGKPLMVIFRCDP